MDEFGHNEVHLNNVKRLAHISECRPGAVIKALADNTATSQSTTMLKKCRF